MIKQKRVFTITLTFFVSLGFSQNHVNQFDADSLRHGLWTKNYSNTKLKRYEGVFQHGKEVDTFKYYKVKNNKSVLSAIRVFQPDTNVADVEFYTSSQKLISKGKTKGKLKIGEWLYYHKNTTIPMIKEYYNAKGQLHGKRYVYYINNAIAERETYTNGVLDGEYKRFFKNNTLHKHAFYKNNKLHGTVTYYDANGAITEVGEYHLNKKIGVWKYYTNGKLIKTLNHTTREVIFKADN